MIIEYSSDAYGQVKLSAQDAFEQVTTMQNGQIQSVAEMYGIDLDNYTNLAQAKKSIEFALLGDLNQGWAEHFGIVVDSLSGMAKATTNLGEYYNNPENQKKVAQYNNLIRKLNDAKERFNSNINYGSAGADKSSKSSGSNKKETDKWMEEYKKKLAELQNQLDKGLINEREFFTQSEILLNTYLKDSQEHMEKYAEEISDAEKTLHNNLVSAYQYEADELGRLRDGNYLDMVRYYQSMMHLQDEYYNSEALKLKNLADTMEAEYGRMSHINLTNRPTVSASDMQAAGYNMPGIEGMAQQLGDARANLENEYRKLSDWGLDEYAEKVKDGTIQSVFGNVDMDKRTIITWSDELKQTYADALSSWDYEPETGGLIQYLGVPAVLVRK